MGSCSTIAFTPSRTSRQRGFGVEVLQPVEPVGDARAWQRWRAASSRCSSRVTSAAIATARLLFFGARTLDSCLRAICGLSARCATWIERRDKFGFALLILLGSSRCAASLEAAAFVDSRESWRYSSLDVDERLHST